MKRLFIFLCLIGLLATCKSDASKQQLTTFILIRHAEKDNDGTKDPDLTEAGFARAAAIATMLRQTSIAAIYSTNFKRTKNTVTLLAKEKQLQVKEYEAFQERAIIKMLTDHAGGTVVVCGHSNSIPWTANLLTGTEDFPEFDESNYSTMLLVNVLENGKIASAVRLSY